jgi:hypothetical protein
MSEPILDDKVSEDPSELERSARLEAKLLQVEGLLASKDWPDKKKDELYGAMKGYIYELTLDQTGCRFIQSAMERLDSKHQVFLVKELRSHVGEALDSSHGNHVLQKCIELLPPDAVEFMLTELIELPSKSAEDADKSSAYWAAHRYGCRVLERFLEHFSLVKPFSEILETYLNDVVKESHELCRHQYGNFVIQHVLEHGSDAQKGSILRMLKDNVEDMAADNHACSVLGKALSYCKNIEQHSELAEALVSKNLVVKMATVASGQGGQDATERLMQVLQENTLALEEAKRQMLDSRAHFVLTKNGKEMLKEYLQVSDIKISEWIKDLGEGIPSVQKSSKSSTCRRHRGTRNAVWSGGPGAKPHA